MAQKCNLKVNPVFFLPENEADAGCLDVFRVRLASEVSANREVDI